MADIDRVKEIVSTLRAILILLLTTSLGLIGFVFINFPKLNNLQLILINIGGVILVNIIIFVSFKLVKHINRLKDL